MMYLVDSTTAVSVGARAGSRSFDDKSTWCNERSRMRDYVPRPLQDPDSAWLDLLEQH